MEGRGGVWRGREGWEVGVNDGGLQRSMYVPPSKSVMMRSRRESVRLQYATRLPGARRWSSVSEMRKDSRTAPVASSRRPGTRR